MRRVLLGGCAVVALTGGIVQAGGLAEPVMPVEVAQERTSSSAGGILIPLLLLIIVAAAASSGGGGGNVVAESDRRLKTDAVWVGMTKDAIPVWRYRYKRTPQVFEGVMAQDVALRRPDALVTRSNGMLAVNYTRLGFEMRQVA
jgi:hypothetical protein